MIVCIGANHLTQKTRETMRISVCGFQCIKECTKLSGASKVQSTRINSFSGEKD